VYCARGDMENRIKEQKHDLAAGRTQRICFRPISFGSGFQG
ncbi:MAG: transposase, partial [Candidatus Sericytochromatia bacterium]|nr:transposase [Candidatus Sericytochromatia bacterium]